MLPDRLTEGNSWDLVAGSSANVIVRLGDYGGVHIGRYFHAIEEWRVADIHGNANVIEWWPIPESGTGNKVND